MNRKLAGYARSGAWSIVAQAIQLLGAVVLSILVVRSLSTQEFGMLSVARQITAFVVILSGLALERVALRFLPELLRARRADAALHFVARTLLLRLMAWLVLLAVTWWAQAALERFFHEEIGRFAVVGVATAGIFSMHNHLRAAATARFAMRSVTLATSTASVLTLGATWAALRAGWGIEGVLLSAGAGMLLGTLWLLPPVFRAEGDPAAEHERAPGLSLRSQRFLAYAAPFAGIALLNYVVHNQTEVFFLGHFRGLEEAGWFQLGFTFSQRLIDFLPLALWEVSLAGFSDIAVRDATRLPVALRSYLVLLYLLLAPLALLGVAFSGSAIRVLYTESMLPAATVSQAYFAIAAVAAFGAPVGMIVYARERVGAALMAYVVFAIVNVGLDLLLIPRLGLWGAIVGLGCAKLLAVLLMARIAWSEVPQLRVPWACILRAFAASLPVLGWLALDDRWTAPWQIALGGCGALALVVLGYRTLRVIGPAERELVAATRLPLRGAFLWLMSPAPRGSA